MDDALLSSGAVPSEALGDEGVVVEGTDLGMERERELERPASAPRYAKGRKLVRRNTSAMGSVKGRATPASEAGRK
jgi:hypothetical protein